MNQTGSAGEQNRKCSLLVIEDAVDIRSLIKLYLDGLGYNVLEAQDGKEALEILRSMDKLPCVILLDLMMPVMDGYAFRREQEKDPKLAGIPIVVMTADAQVQTKTIQIGAKDFLKKPMNIDHLQNMVAKYC